MKMKIIRMATFMLFGLLASVAAAQTFTVRPTAFSSVGAWTPYANPSNAYDNNSTTAATASVQQVGKGSRGQAEQWYGFPSAPPGASGMQLHITSAAQETMPACLSAECTVDIDYYDGTAWHTVYFLENTASRPQQTDVIPLPANVNLTQVVVKAIALADNPCNTCTIRTQSQVYEIWISGND